ncbi:hypothetical protein CMUS01_09037 [Colletotrichum musicola]|uniref:Uncharacterized protein n=1 Tax=Colletotrichum musicola TaxID=2175873 RepID=A0A8H6K9W6_9PEZI|nr:hypothetical protein CMUS01_09037 [Colletotrichum musicola]
MRGQERNNASQPASADGNSVFCVFVCVRGHEVAALRIREDEQRGAAAEPAGAKNHKSDHVWHLQIEKYLGGYIHYGLILGANRLGSTLSPVASPFASIKVFSGSQGSWLLPRKYVRDPSVFAHRRGYIEQISRAWVSYAANVGTDLTLKQSIEPIQISTLTGSQSAWRRGCPNRHGVKSSSGGRGWESHRRAKALPPAYMQKTERS